MLPLLLADFIQFRICKLICAKLLTRSSQIAVFYFWKQPLLYPHYLGVATPKSCGVSGHAGNQISPDFSLLFSLIFPLRPKFRAGKRGCRRYRNPCDIPSKQSEKYQKSTYGKQCDKFKSCVVHQINPGAKWFRDFCFSAVLRA